MSNPLRFGQIVSIQSSEIERMFVTSDGHIKSKAQLLEIDTKKVASGTLFFQSLFQIYPRFMTQRIDQALRIGEELQKSKYRSENIRSAKLQDVEDKVYQEYKQNIEQAEKNKNQPISVAQAVQFLHLSSNKFLACNYFEAEVEKENFKLELNEYPSDNTSFRLIPAYQHLVRSDGLIYADEPIYIIMDKIYLGMKPYMQVGFETKRYENCQILFKRTMFIFPNAKTLQRKILQGQMKQKSIRDDSRDMEEPQTHDMFLPLDYKKKQDLDNIQSQIQETEFILKKEINVSLEKKSPFQIKVFSDPEEDENRIYFGDVLWLHHIELNAILITAKNPQNEIIVSLQQTKNEQVEQFIGNTNGMWYIESIKDGYKGGIVEWGQIFRLRHFSLGKYLAIQKLGDMNCCFYLEERPDENSLLQFLPLHSSLNDNQKYVTKDAFFKLKGANDWIQFIDKTFEEDHTIVMLRLSNTCKDDDVLKCYKANLSEIQETSFLVSCFPIMRKILLMFTHLSKVKDKNKLVRQLDQLKVWKKMEQMQKVLQDLNRFCTHQYIVSSQNRQKVLKEQYFIDILLEILQNISDEQELFSFMEGSKKKKQQIDTSKLVLSNMRFSSFGGTAFHLQQLNTSKLYNQFMQQKVEVIKMIYKLLISICKDNNENELFVYEKLAKFQYQAKFFDETTDFIISLLKNNETLLSNLTDDISFSKKSLRRSHTRQSVSSSLMSSIKKQTYLEISTANDKSSLIVHYVNMVANGKNVKNCLEFFRTICKYNNKGISINQEFIWKLNRDNKKFKDLLFLPIKIEDELRVGTDYLKISELDEKNKDYFVRLLRFYSELALTRNFQWKGHLEQIFPQEFTFNSIFDKKYPPEVRSALCNLALSVYIDHEPFHMQIVPNLCRIINSTHKSMVEQEINLNLYVELVNQVLKEIHDYYEELRKLMTFKGQNKSAYQSMIPLNEAQLQLDIIKLAKTLIQFNVVNMISKKQIYTEIFQPLITFLEYDKSQFVYAYIMNLQREELLRKARSSNKIMNTVMGVVAGVYTGAMDIGRNIVNVVTRKKEALEEECAEQTLFSKHPITSSLFVLTQFIQGFHASQDEASQQIFIQIKLEICQLLIFFQDLRLDFLISNFLKFFVLKQKKSKPQKLREELEVELYSVLPSTLRTGIEEPTQHQPTNLFSAFAQVMNKMSKFLQKKFTNYTQEEEMPDLDVLMSGENKNLVTFSVLPSLLVSFHISNDSQLLDSIVSVIRHSFSQKQELFLKMKDLEILIDQAEINCYYKMLELLAIIRQETEASEVWMEKFLSTRQSDISKLQEVQQVVTDFNTLLYKHTIITANMEIINQNTSNTIISATRQKVFTFISGHVPLLNFIRDSQNQLAKVIKDNQYSVSSKEAATDLLKIFYQCLTNFCRNNRQNQIILAEHYELFVDEIKFDFGQTKLLCAIYEGNKFLCETIQEGKLLDMLHYTKKYGRQARFLELLKVVQVCQKYSLVDNQIKILQLLLPHQSQKEDDMNRHEYWIWGSFQRVHNGIVFDFLNINGDGKHHEPYKYHCKLLDVLLQTTIGEESFKLNTLKLKHFFKLGYLLELLQLRDNILKGYFAENVNELEKLKIKVIQFINWIYLDNDLTQQEVIIKEQFNFIRLFQFEKERLCRLDLYNDRQDYINYFFDNLITIFINFAQKMISNNQATELSEREDYSILSQITKLLLSYSDTLLNLQLKNSQYNNLIKFVKQIDENVQRVYNQKFYQCLQAPFENKSSLCRSIQPILNEEQIPFKANKTVTIFNEKKFLPDQFKINKSPRKQQNNPSHGISSQQILANKNNWQEFLEACENSNILKDQMYQELRALSQAIYNVDKLIGDNYRKMLQHNMDFKTFIKKFIKYVELGVMNKANKENLIYSFRLMEELLCIGDLEEQQNIFDQQNATKMVLNIVSDFKNYPFDDDLFDQLLQFGCKLLEGGNPKVQKTIFQYFTTYSRSENIFCKLNMVIVDHIEDLRTKYKTQIEVKQVNEKEILRLETDYGFPVDQQEDDEEEQQEKKVIRASILVNVLRFVQLFCEGHNLELQNYIRQQFNSRNNFNLVQSIIELLYIYHFEITEENYNNILKCLDTLTEFVQGPCCQNQQTIIDSKFLEVANSLLGLKVKNTEQADQSKSKESDFDEKKSQTNLSKSKNFRQFKIQKQVSIKKYMLERIKFKVMVLVMSLLELNNDSLAVKRIMRSLPVEILKKNLTSIYKRYKKMYGTNYTQEALKHIDQDPDDKNHSTQYHEIILETGFYIYFLISYYSELDTQEIDQETSSELQNAKRSVFNKNLFMDSLIGQVFTFAFAIIGGVLTTFNQLRDFLQKGFEKIGKKKVDPSDLDKKNQLKKQMNQEIFRETIQFFARHSAHIEVVRNNQIERIQFFKPPYCHYLPTERKKEFHEKVDRDSTNSKIQDLIEETDNIIEVCKHEEQLAVFFSKQKFIAIFANYVILWRDLAFILTILLNLFIILSYSDYNSSNDREQRVSYPRLQLFNMNVDETEQLFFICGIVMIVCSTFVVLFFLLKKAPLYIKEAWGKHDLSQYGLLINTIYQLFAIGLCIGKVLFNIEVLYYLTYGTLAFIATFIHPFFFAFHLTEIVIRFPTLRNIIRSFSEPRVELLLTFILIILINYFFTIFAYIYYYDLYDNKCETLLFCFLETFDKAFKNNGGIGGWLDSNQQQDPANYMYGRFFYENLYNIVIVLIMIQIFSGIIIDTFSSLREKQMLRDRDIQETCFICGYSRELFDRKSEAGFKLHIQHEHYMWNYVFYISYLKDKESTEYTGVESYIAEKLKNYDNSWIPINKSLSLKNMVLENQHYESENFEELQGEMELIKSNVMDIVKSMDDLNAQYV